MLQRCGIYVCVLSLLLAGAQGARANPYYLTDLGGISGDTSSWATGINNSGQVVGYSDSGNLKAAHGFFYSAGTFQQLGGLGAVANLPYAVNDSGQVAGMARNAGGTQQAYLTAADGGALTNLTAASGGPLSTSASYAYAISDSGQVAGFGYFSDNGGAAGTTAVPFLYTGSQVSELPLDPSLIAAGEAGGTSQCDGINNSGEAVGAAQYQPPKTGFTPTQGQLPVLYKNGVEYNLGFIGVSGPVYLAYGPSCSAQAINAGGQIAGYTLSSSLTQIEAFLWTPTVTNGTSGTMAGLGILPGGTASYAEAVNTTGTVVGYGDTTSGADHAFLYSGGTLTDLNTLLAPAASGWVIDKATGINDSGAVIGDATNSAGATQAVLLTPALGGDANLDGKVDINDLTIVLAHFGQTGASWSSGDFIGDGKVDINDLTIVLSNFGKSGAAAAAGAPLAVPEPGALALLLAAGVLGLSDCARRRGVAGKV